MTWPDAWPGVSSTSGVKSPTRTEVTLADLDPRPGQRFLYIFDFGDNLRHSVEELEVFDAPSAGELPRIVESHGRAPRRSGYSDEESAV